MEMIEGIAIALGANALVLFALGYLARSLIGHLLQKDIAEFKSDLQLAAQREIEEFKARLEKDRLRLQISYGGIFEKQASAILDLYRSVLAMERAASDAVHAGGPISERADSFHKAWAAIKSSYHDNRILIPSDIDELLARFIERMYRGVFGVVRVERRDLSRVTAEEFRRLGEQQDKAYEIIESELPELRERLVLAMRQTVGVAANDF